MKTNKMNTILAPYWFIRAVVITITVLIVIFIEDIVWYAKGKI